MAKAKHRSNQVALSKRKRNRLKLEYQRYEERKLLAADLFSQPVRAEFANAVEIAQPSNSEDIIRHHLATNQATAWLQNNQDQISIVASDKTDDGFATVFQHSWDGLAVFNSYVTVVQDSNGNIINVRDQAIQNVRDYSPSSDQITAEQGIAAANRGLGKPAALEADASLSWYYAGNKARLSWLVDTTVSNNQGVVVNQYETWVDVVDGDIFHRELKSSAVNGLLADPIRETGVFPRIVINDTIGAAGSQNYGAQWDSVVSISVGCTGTLIAPDAVITARHCNIGTGDTVSFGDNSNTPDLTVGISAVLDPAGGGTLLDGGDVTILTLSQDVPASVATPMRFIDATDDLVGMTAVTTGYGWNGVGSTGHQFSADGLRWAGQNVIETFGSPAASSGANIISTDFDDGTAANNTIGSSSSTPLELEATTAPGDSGGPILVDVGGEWVIAGVLSGGTDGNSFYGDISWWTGTAAYRSEIETAGGTFVGDGAGRVNFDRESYFVGDTISVSIRDGNATGDITATVTSDTGDTETVTVSPDSPGVYSFSLESAFANIVDNDGTLQLAVGDQIEVSYLDADDGDGNSATVTDTATILEISSGSLVGADFDNSTSDPAPSNWLSISDGSDSTFSNLNNEEGGATQTDLTINGSWEGFSVAVTASTIPQHPNSIANVDGQIFTGADPIELVYSDLDPLAEYEVYVMAVEGFFDSIEQNVSIQGDGSPITFEQRFDQGDLFVNDQVGDSSRALSEYAQVVTSDASGQITIDVTPIAGTEDVVLAGIAIFKAESTNNGEAIDDTASTDEDEAVNINVLANDTDLTVDSVGNPDNGTASINPNGTVRYVPDENFFGTDTFTYTGVDADDNTSSATVTVTVNAVNDAPTGVALSPAIILEGTDTSAGDVEIGILTGLDVDDSDHSFEFVMGDGDVDNDTFVIDGNSLSIKAGTEIDFDTQSEFTVRVAASDGEFSAEQMITISVTEELLPANVVINGGDVQRSMLNELTISFNEIVTFTDNAFELIRRGPDGGAVGVTPTVDNSTGVSVVTLTFDGEFVDLYGSLVAGNYQVTIVGDEVTTSGGTALDGDNDGTAGGNYTFGDTATDNFYRLFGDGNGDRLSDIFDFIDFRSTWNRASGSDDFDDRFDYNLDGVVNIFDFIPYRDNYLTRVDFE